MAQHCVPSVFVCGREAIASRHARLGFMLMLLTRPLRCRARAGPATPNAIRWAGALARVPTNAPSAQHSRIPPPQIASALVPRCPMWMSMPIRARHVTLSAVLGAPEVVRQAACATAPSALPMQRTLGATMLWTSAVVWPHAWVSVRWANTLTP